MARPKSGRCSRDRWTRFATPRSTSQKPIPTSLWLDAKALLLGGLAAVLVLYLVTIVRGGLVRPTVLQSAIGFATAFLDTLGIGSFATTTSIYKLRHLVPVKLIPGTLNVGHTMPTIAQAFIYTQLVPVESTTLMLMIAAAMAGSWLGAGVVIRWPRRTIQIGMGLALLGAAAMMLMTSLDLFPKGGDTLGLTGVRLAIGLGGNFVLGALMMLGIGLYGPCMILVYLLGMTPTAAFPIMMGSCAFLMPVSTVRFVRTRTYDVRAALGLALGGLPAALIAALLVKSLQLNTVRWLVVVVVVYTAVTMLATATEKGRKAGGLQGGKGEGGKGKGGTAEGLDGRKVEGGKAEGLEGGKVEGGQVEGQEGEAAKLA